MAGAEHRKDFHEQLESLTNDVNRLAALATEAVARGTQAVLDADLDAIEAVIADDHVLDDLTHDMEERSYLLLARQQPMAVDLRTIVSILRTIHELERIGDLMVNVAKGGRRIYPRELDPKIRGILDRMGRQAAEQIRISAQAFVELDPARAAALDDMDDAMDDLQKELFRAIFAAGAEDEEALHSAVQISLVGRYYERIADHAVNIAERVLFMVTGEIPGTDHEIGATSAG